VPSTAAGSLFGVHLEIARQELQRDLDGDGVHVVARHVVRRDVHRVVLVVHLRQHAAAGFGPEVQRVEGAAEVDVERIVGRAGEAANAVAEVVDALVVERLVVRHRARAHIGRHRVELAAAAQIERPAVADGRHGVALAQAEAFGAGAVEGGDLRNAEQAAHEAGEDARVALFGLEAELERDVFDRVVVVVDLHLVEHVGIEGEVVGPVGRLEQRIDRQHHRQLRGSS
jgi:hypothetical protein